MKQVYLADIWGDTVDLHDLGKGIIIGIIISLSCYLGANKMIAMQAPDMAEKLVSAYSLLFGIGGCVISAIVSANLFKPKRTLNEEQFSEPGFSSLYVNEFEKEELKYADPKVLQEMKDLKLYELFYGPERTEQTPSSPPKGDET